MTRKQYNKHRDVIVAWGNGETIQFRGNTNRVWKDLNDEKHDWLDSLEYRIKPEGLTKRDVEQLLMCRDESEVIGIMFERGITDD